jgi:hypothetical protein
MPSSRGTVKAVRLQASGMEDEAEDLRRAVTLGDHEARIAAPEKRLNELETQQRGRIPDSAYTQAINVQAKRLAHLETRQENLLRHTPEARENQV